MRFPVFAFLVIGCGFPGFSFLQGEADAKLAEQIFATGERLYTEGKYKLAADTLARSTVLFEQSGKIIEQVRSANLQAECLANLNQCDQAGALLQRSLATVNDQPGDNREVLADTYYYLSRHTGGCARKFDDAIGLMQKSVAIKKELYNADDPSLAFNYTFLGYIYNSKGKYDSALMFLDQAIAIRNKHLKADDVEISHTLFNLAASYEGKSDLGKALSTNLLSLKIRLTTLDSTNATVSNSINSIGRIYRKLGNNERALEYYRQALDIRKTTLGPTHPNVAASYYEIGNLYGNSSNYHAALEYIEQGNRILESNTQITNDVLPTYIAYAGKMYGLTGQTDQATASIQKAIALAEKKLTPTHPYRAIVYNIAAEFYGDKGDIQKQSEFAKKAIAIYQSSYGAGSEREADVVAKMASTHAKLGDANEALKLYQQALAMYTGKLGEQNPKVASVHLGIGDVYAGIKDFPAAEDAYAQAMKIASADNRPLMLKINRSKAKAAKPEAALAFYRSALQILDQITQDYNSDAARVQLEKERREIFVDFMNVAWQLYNNDASLLPEAFTMAEKSKSTLLLENTKDQQAKTLAGVPDSLASKERDLRIELAYYKNSLYQSEKTRDTSAAQALRKTVFDTERKLESFKSQLERNYPVYYRAKYSPSTIELTKLQQQLPDNTTLLQYFVGDSSIYCFEISRTAAQFKRQSFNTSFKETLAGYQKSLTDFHFLVNDPANADSLYVATSRSLFSLLMLPKPTGSSQKLIIVPDDFLAQFNFATLLSEDPKGNNYAELPYLGNKYTISYTYSASFLGNPDRKSAGGNFAGFAPSYDNNDYSAIDSVEHPMTALAMRSGYLPLPGATQEVNIISKLMRGTSWLDEEATETNFKKHSGDYDVLHLAMHSLLNDDEPRYSELLFNHRNDKENDGYLTISEIYNLKLNAQLVVLSACSSGFGKIQNGEGPISLSRAFSYAGCPSVVMTLWKVPDVITTNIMQNFYENLTEGLGKDEALRAAQQKFLRENTDPLYRHPYYWAGFVVIGDTAPLQTSSPYLVYYIVFGVFIAGAVSLKFFKQSKSSR